MALDYDALFERIGDARVVLLGEATHGTTEFYAERARISQRLIQEKNFNAIAVEADWPDAYRVNCYARGAKHIPSSADALGAFTRFPIWMWRNTEVASFVDWLRDHNLEQAETSRVGFYGLDLYSLHASMRAVVEYLDRTDPAAAQRARERYSCFELFGTDTEHYAHGTHLGIEPCSGEVLAQLVELREHASEYAQRDGRSAIDEYFFAEQNARLAKNAEEYYRSLFGTRGSSWNLRDAHMAETLDALLAHLDGTLGTTSKAIVWAHNSHVGDATHTEMGRRGELNIGQLARERYGAKAVNVGFTTYRGTVTAADNWDELPALKVVLPAIRGSYEALLHGRGVPEFVTVFDRDASEQFPQRALERAIGVIYRPKTERWSHYFEAELTQQFDAVIHIDETTAVEPLDRVTRWHGEELPETYPTGV